MVLPTKGMVLAAVLATVVVLSSNARADYTITRLPAFDGIGSEAFGINALGQVVGDEQFRQTFAARLWNDGRLINLGTGAFSRAFGINTSGQVVGNIGGNAFVWQNGQVTDLGVGIAFGIND